MNEYYDFTHEDIVNVGKKILKDEGFPEDRIKTEIELKTPKGRLRIDVVGVDESNTPVFGIECGNIHPNPNYTVVEKINYLNGFFQKFLHLPYEMFKKGKITQYEEKMKFLVEENNKLSDALLIMGKQLEQHEKMPCSIMERMLDVFHNFEQVGFDFMSWVSRFDERVKLETDETAWYLQIADRFENNAVINKKLSCCSDHGLMSRNLKDVKNKFLKEMEIQKEIIKKSDISSSDLLHGSISDRENMFFQKDGFHRKEIKFETQEDRDEYKNNLLDMIERMKKLDLKSNLRGVNHKPKK